MKTPSTKAYRRMGVLALILLSAFLVAIALSHLSGGGRERYADADAAPHTEPKLVRAVQPRA
jgi:hypothetical protein